MEAKAKTISGMGKMRRAKAEDDEKDQMGTRWARTNGDDDTEEEQGKDKGRKRRGKRKFTCDRLAPSQCVQGS